MRDKKQSGFTLIEMLLVMVIISLIVYAGIGYVQRRTEQIRIDKTSLQTQQILNAALAFYVTENKWPKDVKDLVTNGYLPNLPGGYINPWNNKYQGQESNDHSLFYVWSQTTSSTPGTATIQAGQISGSLPLSYTSSDNSSPPKSPADDAKAACGTTTTKCNVVSAVTIPGKNLNNANALSFAGLYKHGGCVPVPQCPVDADGNKMTPQVFVVPVSVSGVNDATSGTTPNVYPISSFTAYATPTDKTPDSDSPPLCTGSNSVHADNGTQCKTVTGTPSTGFYWRACLQVVTQRGDTAGVGSSDTAWGRFVTLMAVTRCSVSTEASGSTFQVYSN